MSSLKKLAGQTFWYGGSSIIARMLNYLMTPYLTATLSGVSYGEVGIMYAFIPFLNVIFTYGLETAYFRFASRDADAKKVYDTSSTSIVISTLALTALLFLFKGNISRLLLMEEHPEIITYTILIIALDTLAALPFSYLRLQGRPVKFAMVRIINILTTIALTIFLISILPGLAQRNPGSFWASLYKPGYHVVYVIIANLSGSFIQLLFLSKEFFGFRFRPDWKLWKQMMLYALPLIIVGFGGMINEVADRLMLGWWSPAATEDGRKEIAGIYNGVYKLSILITLFIQAFRMGAEPFFFKQAEGKNPQRIYARVMKFFVITITLMFLVVALYLDVWKEFLRNPLYWTALGVVPILLLANMFLGIYYNLSIWYKVTNKTTAGMWITLIGAVITLLVNYTFIPIFSFYASAWATFLCYGSMMVLSYLWGQKVYPVPYPTKKLFGYIMVVVAIFMMHKGIALYLQNKWLSLLVATIFMAAYCWLLAVVEQKELEKLPFVGKYFRTKKAMG